MSKHAAELVRAIDELLEFVQARDKETLTQLDVDQIISLDARVDALRRESTGLRMLRPAGTFKDKNVFGYTHITSFHPRPPTFAVFVHPEWVRRMQSLRANAQAIVDALNDPDTGELRAIERRAIEIIKADGPILGKTLAKKLGVQETTLRRHILPPLRSLGVKNNQDRQGYFFDP